MLLSWAEPIVAELTAALTKSGTPLAIFRTWIFKDHVQVIDLRHGEHVMGFDIGCTDDLYTVNFVQRGKLETFSLLPGPVTRNRLLAKDIPAAEVVPLLCDALATVRARIEAAAVQGPAPDYVIYENAVLVPPRMTGPRAYDNSGGVFTSGGTFIAEAVTITEGNPRHAPAPFPETPPVTTIPGTHAFGGIFFGHFGHFITESTGRLWILGEEKLSLDSIVYLPKAGPASPPVVQRQQDLLAALGIHAQLHVVEGPTVVERLVVPRAGFGLDDKLIDGSPLYAAYMRKVAANRPPAAPRHEKLYVSRSHLAFDRGSFLGETYVEELLRAEGYAIWHPQESSPAEQVAHYAAARQIISMDASPLHLYAYVAHDSQKLAIIQRRSQEAYRAILRHIKAFAAPEIRVIDTLLADHVPAGWRVGRSSWGEISIAALGRELAAMGMIAHPERWQDLPQDAIAAQLETIATTRGTTFERRPCPR